MTQQTRTERDQFIDTFDREFETTLRVLNAYPIGKCDFKPAEKSRSGREMAWNFIESEKAIADGMKGSTEMPKQTPVPQKTVQEITRMYEQQHREIASQIRTASPEAFEKTVRVPSGPGSKTEDARVGDLCWMMLMDSINHRGQLVVYLRILDAKVPSIYGPSADEPW